MKSFLASSILLACSAAQAAQVKFTCWDAYEADHATVLTLTGDLAGSGGTVKTEYMSRHSTFDPIGVQLVWSFKDGNTTFQFNRDTNGLTHEYQFMDGGPKRVQESATFMCVKAAAKD